LKKKKKPGRGVPQPPQTKRGNFEVNLNKLSGLWSEGWEGRRSKGVSEKRESELENDGKETF